MGSTKLLVNDCQRLSGVWTAKCLKSGAEFPFSVPGDIHSALLASDWIPDPYWREMETSLDWIHENEWQITRRFEAQRVKGKRAYLTLESVDCFAIVSLNGIEVGKCQSQFVRYDFDVTEALLDGENELEVHFLSNSKIAKEKHDSFEFEVPYLAFNNRLPHYNFLRKTQCHAGWDWNIALSPVGLYGDVILRQRQVSRLDDISMRQRHEDGVVHIDITAFCEILEPGTVGIAARTGEHAVSDERQLWPGEQTLDISLTIPNPRLWWPAGYGEQALYDLTIEVGEDVRHFRIGLKKAELIRDRDDIGCRFAFRVNDREIFMRGANWIPVDALPSRATPDVVRDRLTSAVEANMNMLRIWGGGQYEPDWFYELCSELGLLVWQDFMFACNLYPSSDREWLGLVRLEARQQVRRLSSHACMTLWCGDNELVGALGWYPESKQNRDRYLAMYERINFALQEVVEEENLDIAFWPSSPSIGPLNFGDSWHDDTSGDMHFWDVWHSSKEFEHYRTVRPRFCSEFGFQSFPSMRVIESFTEPHDRNVSSRVMDVHQRNEGGNSRIVETISRYFRFPDSFEDLVYLSQISQAMAMKTAIEFWRSNKPRCMGTLYWQLNDTWPVASWSGLEYGGGWKLMHYMARQFYSPVLLTAQPDMETGDVVVYAVNDTESPVLVLAEFRYVSVSGEVRMPFSLSLEVPTDCAVEAVRFPLADFGEAVFLAFNWSCARQNFSGENFFLPKAPRDYDWQDPEIQVGHLRSEENGEIVRLTCKKPALYTSYGLGGDDIYSDNCFTMIPGQTKELCILRKRVSHLGPQVPELQYLKG